MAVGFHSRQIGGTFQLIGDQGKLKTPDLSPYHPNPICSNTTPNPSLCGKTHYYPISIYQNTSPFHLHLPHHHSIFMWPNMFFTKCLFFQTLSHLIFMCLDPLQNPSPCTPKLFPSHPPVPQHQPISSPYAPTHHHLITMWTNSVLINPHIPQHITLYLFGSILSSPNTFCLDTIPPNPYVPHTSPTPFGCVSTYLHVAQHHHTSSPMCPNTIPNPTHVPQTLTHPHVYPKTILTPSPCALIPSLTVLHLSQTLTHSIPMCPNPILSSDPCSPESIS